MTNAEKYLKNNVNVEELRDEFVKFYHNKSYVLELSFTKFFEAEDKPTLTEDERVILRNIKKDYKIIGKDSTHDVFVADNLDNNGIRDVIELIEFGDNLFQFIKDGEEYSIEELLDEQDTKN